MTKALLDYELNGDAQLLRIVWRSAYACGVEEIDNEHRALFRQAGDLLDTMARPEVDSAAVETSVKELIALTARHFAGEEKILRAHDYPQLEAHADRHRRLLSDIEKLYRNTNRAEKRMVNLVEYFAVEVIARHLLVEDREFFPLFDKSLGR